MNIIWKNPNQSQSELLSAFQKGDTQAFNQIFNQYFLQVCYFTRRIINDASESENITTNAFLALYEQKENHETLSGIENFLFDTVLKDCIHFLKSGKTETGNGTDLQIERLENKEYVNSQIVKAQLAALRFNQAINLILEQSANLPVLQQKIITLSIAENLYTFEIAQHLGITVDSVRVHKAKAIHFLWKLFRERKAEPLDSFALDILRKISGNESAGDILIP